MYKHEQVWQIFTGRSEKRHNFKFVHKWSKFSQYKIKLMLSAYIHVCYLIIEGGLYILQGKAFKPAQ